VIVEVSSRKFSMPFECPCCGAAPDADTRVNAPNGQGVDVPYCQRCLDHITAWESAGVASTGVAVLGVVIAAVVGLAKSPLYGFCAFALVVVLASWLRNKRRAAAANGCGPSCATPRLALGYLGWSGTTTAFSFESPTYAARFAEANSQLLANESPQLKKLIEGYRKARLAVPTPAVAAGVAPPPMNARDWLARIESTPGKVARRVALGRALEMVTEPQPRRELVQTATRLELAPLLDKLQRSSSPAAKRQLLVTSLEQLPNDNLPDELEVALRESLQARIQELN
jgi:hypothetical protein